MPTLLISALVSSFTFVRLLKGSWSRNPQFLAAAMIGSVVFSLAGENLYPGSGDNFITGNILVFAGSALGIFLFDLAS